LSRYFIQYFKDVSLHLPENYELIAGNKLENIHSYFDLAEVTAVGDIHCIKLIINIALKSANRHFLLYKTIALPTRICGDKCVFDNPCFGLDRNQHDCILLTEANLIRCIASSITICPANMATCDARALICQDSLYFHTAQSYSLCRSFYCYITKLRHYNGMERFGCTSFWNRGKPLYTARETTTRHLTPKRFPVLA